MDGEIIEFNGVDFEMHKKYMALKNKNAVRERIFIGQEKTTELILSAKPKEPFSGPAYLHR